MDYDDVSLSTGVWGSSLEYAATKMNYEDDCERSAGVGVVVGAPLRSRLQL